MFLSRVTGSLWLNSLYSSSSSSLVVHKFNFSHMIFSEYPPSLKIQYLKKYMFSDHYIFYATILDENNSIKVKIIGRALNAREPIVLLKKINKNRNKQLKTQKTTWVTCKQFNSVQKLSPKCGGINRNF